MIMFIIKYVSFEFFLQNLIMERWKSNSGVAVYLQTSAWGSLPLSALVWTVSNMLYFLSFYILIREWSVPIAVLVGQLAFDTIHSYMDYLYVVSFSKEDYSKASNNSYLSQKSIHYFFWVSDGI